MDNPNNTIVKCKTPKCPTEFDRKKYTKTPLVFCNKCFKFNCLECNTIHDKETCAEYQKDIENFQNKFEEKSRNKNLKYVNEIFECGICYTDIEPYNGITLQECDHKYCIECLIGWINEKKLPVILCPSSDVQMENPCPAVLQHREIRAFGGEELYQQFLEFGFKFTPITDEYQCKTVDCSGRWIIDKETKEAVCNICYQRNCYECKAIHLGQTCQEYQEYSVKQENDKKENDKYFEDLIAKGEGMYCPGCSIVINRIAGCDWLKCIKCATEICWATKQSRWGPNGVGDISGGCKCGVNGRRCHPNCTSCH